MQDYLITTVSAMFLILHTSDENGIRVSQINADSDGS